MPPKPAVNGYSLFIKKEGRQLLEQDLGRSVGVKEAHEKCSSYWAQMSPAEKDDWKQRAKNYRHTEDWQQEKEEMRERQLRRKAEEGPQGRKAAAAKNKKRPVTMKAEEDDKRIYTYYEEDDFEAFERKREIDRNAIKEDMLWTSPAGNQDKNDEYIRFKSFFAISVVTYFEATFSNIDGEPKRLFPLAEIALLKFNLEDGMQNEWTWKVAHGYEHFPTEECYYQALERSEDRVEGHGIPVQQNEETFSEVGLTHRWAKILGDITEKVRGQKRIYCYSKHYNKVQGGLMWLREKAMEQTGRVSVGLGDDKVACFEDLVAGYLMFGRMKPNQFEIDSEINPGRWKAYDLNPSTVCAYHGKRQKKNCALGHVKKLMYALFNFFDEEGTFSIDVGRGHIPNSEAAPVGNVEVMDAAFRESFARAQPTSTVAMKSTQNGASGGSYKIPVQEEDDDFSSFNFVHSSPIKQPISANVDDGWEIASSTSGRRDQMAQAPPPRRGWETVSVPVRTREEAQIPVLIPPSAFERPSVGQAVSSGVVGKSEGATGETESGNTTFGSIDSDLGTVLPAEVVTSRPPSTALGQKMAPKTLPPRLGRGRGSRPSSVASSVAPGSSLSQRATPAEFVQWESAEMSRMSISEAGSEVTSVNGSYYDAPAARGGRMAYNANDDVTEFQRRNPVGQRGLGRGIPKDAF